MASKTKSRSKTKTSTARRTRRGPINAADVAGPAGGSTEGATAIPDGFSTEPAKTTDNHKLTFVTGSPGSVPAEDQTAYEGEDMPPLTGETWVQLGDHEAVPERYRGSIAAVIDPIPVAKKEDPVTGQVKEYTHPDAQLHVRERSQGAELWLPLEAIKKVSLAGRAILHKVV